MIKWVLFWDSITTMVVQLLSILKTTELYRLNGRNVRCVNYSSKKKLCLDCLFVCLLRLECIQVAVGKGNGDPLQYSCLENPMDGGAWWAAVHGVARSRTRLSDFPFTFHFALEKEMATHSSVLAWRIPGTGEPHGLPSMGSNRVGHD